jgi:drug/metabolite transporter (DMT)-like permease
MRAQGNPALRADLALLGVAFIWGATFPVMKLALEDASPAIYLALRFALAALLALPLLVSERGHWSRREVGAGLLLGGLLAGSFALQTLGLARIGPARSAFLTSLYVVFVPLLSVPLLGRLPRAQSLVGVACALVGLGFMTWEGGGFNPQPGDLLTLGGAVGFALHIIGVGVLTSRYDYRRLFVLQVCAAAVLLIPAISLETPRLVFSLRFAVALMVTGGLATTLAFYVQNRVQRHSTPTRTAIIFAMEPVFAVLVTAASFRGDKAASRSPRRSPRRKARWEWSSGPRSGAARCGRGAPDRAS